MKILWWKDKTKERDSLAIYNAKRLPEMIRTLEENHQWRINQGFKLDPLTTFDRVIHTINFIKRELERDYNENAHIKCEYCEQYFDGWNAHKRMIEHEFQSHKSEIKAYHLAVAYAYIGMVGL